MIVNNLSFSYKDNKVLDQVSFKVKEAEILGIIGESGAGKSTLLRLLGNLIPLQSGEIINECPVGIIFQDFNLFPHLNVLDNLSLSLKVNKTIQEDKIIEKAKILLNDFGILDKALSFPDQLSGGERQRVAITRALMLEPEILLVDEATSSLDPKRRDEFMGLLLKLKKSGMSVIIVSHDHEILNQYSDRLIYLEKGFIVKTEILTI